MNEKQVIFALYNYIFSELSRLENVVNTRSKFLSTYNGSSSYVYRYWCARIEYENFKKFAEKILLILKFYDEE